MAVEERPRKIARGNAGNAATIAAFKFKPGNNANPGGRPKLPAEIREAALALTPEAIETLGKIMRDERTPPATRVIAADKILDRALGGTTSC
jgi:hypothetical protein